MATHSPQPAHSVHSILRKACIALAGVLGVALAIGIGVTAVALAVTNGVLIWRRRD